MKKIFTTFVIALMAVTSVKAQHEIGAVVGGMNGLSYKCWFSNNFALQADAAVGMTATAFSYSFYGHTQTMTVGFWDFTVNPNAEYHFILPNNFKFYVGGGVNLGMLGAFEGGGVGGKFGINAIAGAQFNPSSLPLAFALDFRPGYGLMFEDQPGMSFFDWKIALAVRYRL